jgi:hypothetical protein
MVTTNVEVPMQRLIRSILTTILVLLATGQLDAQPTPNTIGTVQTMTVSARDLDALRAATRAYLSAALEDEDAFFAAVSNDYIAINTNGKTYRAGQVFGLVQAAKLNLGGILSRTQVIDAHHLGDLYDETAVLGGSADTIDAGGAHVVTAAWLHKITFHRQADGTFKVVRDQVLQRVQF